MANMNWVNTGKLTALEVFLVLSVLLPAFFFTGCGDESVVGGGGGGGVAGRLYVLNQEDATMYIYNTSTMARIDSINTGVDRPHYIEFAPDGQHYYITTLETLGGHIAKFDAATNVMVDSVAVPPGVVPSAIAITANSKFGYVCNFSSPSQNTFIHKYDLTTMQHVASLQAGAMTHDVKITADDSLIVACNRNSDNLTLVYPGADSTRPVPMDSVNPQPIGQPVYGPFGVIIDSHDSLAYIACMDADQVRVLDIQTRQIVDSIDIPVAGTSTLAGPTLLAISPDDSVVFLTTQVGNSVVAFSTATGSILADIPLSTPSPFGITISDDGSRVYVACVGVGTPHGRVYVIDGNTYAKLDSVDVGRQSFGLIWHSATP